MAKDKKIVQRAYVNKRNNQLTVTIPRKKLKKVNPTIKFNEDLFVSLEPFNKKKRSK